MTHDELVIRAVRWLKNTVRCVVVAGEPWTPDWELPDAIGWKSWASWLVECKTSRADFFRDQKKGFRRAGAKSLGNYRYYMTPPGLIHPNELPPGWGLLEVHPKIVRRVMDSGGFPNELVVVKERMLLVSMLRKTQETTDEDTGKETE